MNVESKLNLTLTRLRCVYYTYVIVMIIGACFYAVSCPKYMVIFHLRNVKME